MNGTQENCENKLVSTITRVLFGFVYVSRNIGVAIEFENI